MNSFQSKRNAFTLVELMVAMVILGIISSMVAIALTGAQRQAQQTRAQGIVDALNLRVLQIYEEQTFRNPPIPANATSSDTRALATLMWKRDWLRCALPDRREDLVRNPVRVPFPSSTGLQFLDDGSTAGAYVGVPSVTTAGGADSTRGQQLLFYRKRIWTTVRTAQNNTTATSFAELVDNNLANGEWTSEHQSAECLYLILSTNVVNGLPASDMLRSRDIGDTDEDGMPEVLDPWGEPVGFLRWPCGFPLTPEWDAIPDNPASTTARANWTDLATLKSTLGRDNLDILQADPRYNDNRSSPPPVNANAEDPYPLIPMVISPGLDGEFDLFGLDLPDLDSNGNLPVASTQSIFYATSGNGWPNESGSFVAPAGFPTGITYTFVDPYLDDRSVGTTPGARVDADGDGEDQSADNVYPALFF